MQAPVSPTYTRRVLMASLGLAAALKWILHSTQSVPFNSDEAIIGLMARHILQGQLPTFFYGQAYMGSLDAFLVAALFGLVGESVLAIRLVQIGLYLGYLLSLYALAKNLFRSTRLPLLAVGLGIVPSVLVTTYTTPSLGGYGETLLLGNGILLLGWHAIYGRQPNKPWVWLGLGLVSGLAFWTLAMAGIYIATIALLGVWAGLKRNYLHLYGLAGMGFLAGSSPWWVYNLIHDWQALAALSGPAVQNSNIFIRLIGLLGLGLPAILGLRFPWRAEMVPTLFLLIGFVLQCGALSFFSRGLWRGEIETRPGARRLLALFSLVFLSVFLLTAFGLDATGRYLLPLNLLVVFAGAALLDRTWCWRAAGGKLLLACFLLFNLLLTLTAAGHPERITTQFGPQTRFDNSYDQELLTFLQDQGAFYGYSNYWVSFRLAFLSQEKMIYVARLPYRANLAIDPADNRYPDYDRLVAESQRVALITTLNPALDAYLHQRLAELEVAYQYIEIGVYHLFYGLEAPLPAELLDFRELIPAAP